MGKSQYYLSLPEWYRFTPKKTKFAIFLLNSANVWYVMNMKHNFYYLYYFKH